MRLLLLLALVPFLHGQPAILTADLPWAAVEEAYYAPIETTADPRCLVGGGISLMVTEGELPHGFLLRGSTIMGVTSEIGVFRFAIRAYTPCASALKVFTLTVSGRPILRAVPEQVVFEYHAGDATPKEQTIFVRSTWAGLAYQVTKRNNATWLQCSPRRGATPSADSAFSADTVTIRVDPAKMAAGTYADTLQVSTWQGADVSLVTVTLKVF
jgi:hypothetical protein